MKPNIFIIGGTTYDHVISLPEFPKPIPQTIHQATFFEGTGSTGSGKALALTKLEMPNTLYSVLGNDAFGKQIIDYLASENVNLIYDFDEKGTERHFNMMDAEGNRISIFITQSSENTDFNLELIEQTIQKSDILVINIIAYCHQLVPLLKKYDKPIWTDLHDYNDGNSYHEPFIEVADYIFLSSDNLSDYQETMKKLIQGKELVVCTHGKNGATALTKTGEWIDQPALENILIVDTNGAGDNFFAGFLYAHTQGKSILECLKYGVICGASAITSKQLISSDLNCDFLEEKYQNLF